MVNCGSLSKIALVVVMMAVFASGSPAEKLASCCKTVNKKPITEPITGYMVQQASLSCVRAVIFQTEKGLFCTQIRAPWVRRKISAFERSKARANASVAPSSSVSLLSFITSTSSPQLSSTLA